MEVIAALTQAPGTNVVVLVLAEIYEDEDRAELAAKEIHARLAEAMAADINEPIRVAAERLALPPGVNLERGGQHGVPVASASASASDGDG